MLVQTHKDLVYIFVNAIQRRVSSITLQISHDFSDGILHETDNFDQIIDLVFRQSGLHCRKRWFSHIAIDLILCSLGLPMRLGLSRFLDLPGALIGPSLLLAAARSRCLYNLFCQALTNAHLFRFPWWGSWQFDLCLFACCLAWIFRLTWFQLCVIWLLLLNSFLPIGALRHFVNLHFPFCLLDFVF